MQSPLPLRQAEERLERRLRAAFPGYLPCCYTRTTNPLQWSSLPTSVEQATLVAAGMTQDRGITADSSSNLEN